MTAYSFKDVQATIVGPGGAFALGGDADVGVDAGGITIDYVQDRDTMTIGADGAAMHSLHAGSGSNVLVRLQKTSAVNQMLSAMYDLQISSSTLWGINTIVVTNIAMGDVTTCLKAAFRRAPPLTYATDGTSVEWGFNCGKTYSMLGSGNPTL